METTVERGVGKWLAERTGFSKSWVSLVLNGLRPPSLHTMRRIEEATGWPMSEQLGTLLPDYPEALEAAVIRAREAEEVATP